MIIPIQSFHFKNNPENHTSGIISYLKDENGEELISKGIVSFQVPTLYSVDQPPSLIFGFNNTNYLKYFSTNYTDTEPEFIFFDFHDYSLAIESISIKTDEKDWYDQYTLKGSYDNYKIDTIRTFDCTNFPDLSWQNFEFKKTRPSRFLNLTVKGNSHQGQRNFAIYGIEFFGDLYKTSREIVCMFCTCRKIRLNRLKHIPLSFVTFIK